MAHGLVSARGISKEETRMIGRRDVMVAVLAMSGTLGAVAAVDEARTLIGSGVYDLNSVLAKKTGYGDVRQVMEGPTTTMERLELHVTTLNPGERPHPPHKHPNEEMLIIREGTLETLSNGEWKRVGPGAVIFNASNQVHDIRNVGTTPAVYHVINWRTDKTPAGETVVVGK